MFGWVVRYLASMAQCKTTVAVTATTYSPPLRGLINNGTAGTISVKGSSDSAARDFYLPQGGQLTWLEVKEVTAIGAGMSVVGAR